MEPKFQTSFIPKTPVTSSQISPTVSVIRGSNILSLLTTLLFIITIFVAGGLFVYERLLNGQIEEAGQAIEQASAAFEPEKIQEILDASSRINSSKQLLEKHVALSGVLAMLEELTVRRVRLTSLLYLNVGGKPNINAKLESPTYNALAQQSVIFSDYEFIKKPEYSGFLLGDSGIISIDFSAEIEPTLISYKENLEESIVSE